MCKHHPLGRPRLGLTRKLICVAGLLCAWAGPVSAVIIYGGNGVNAPANDTAPAGFEDAWARVGEDGPGTGIYLGNGFVVTAGHVSIGSNGNSSFTIDGVDYAFLPQGSYRVKNADNSNSDIRVHRVAVPEGTPLHGLGIMPILENSLATLSPNPEQGVIIAAGVGQTTLQPISLAPVGGPSGNGYVWSTTRDVRWAFAEIGKPNSTPDLFGFTSDEGFESAFKFFNGADGIAADQDSGGGLFYDDNGTIVLAGLINAVSRSGYARQNDITYLSDLAGYYDQLQFVLGDLDGDGDVGASDLDLVVTNFGQTVQAGNWYAGDADGDGLVGINDLDYVLAHWTQGTAPSNVVVPEPTSLMLIGGAMALIASRRRRR